jgi:Protein of unknown function (DUF3108)
MRQHDIVCQMKTGIPLSLSSLIMTVLLTSSAVFAPDPVLSTSGELKKNPIFTEGEELIFDVSWMGIRAGTITISIEDAGIYDGQPALKGTVVAETSKMFSRFFHVKDVITSVFSKDDLLSLYYKKSLKEGKYGKVRTTLYDQVGQTAIASNKIHKILPESRDPVACIFALRNAAINVPSAVKMNANSEGKNYPIEVKMVFRETLAMPNGNMNAVKCEPLPSWEGRVFEKDKSNVVLWLSDDEYRVPLKIRTKVKIGSINADLVARKGPGWEIRRAER